MLTPKKDIIHHREFFADYKRIYIRHFISAIFHKSLINTPNKLMRFTVVLDKIKESIRKNDAFF
jgi:hypothetical protein